MNTLSIIIFSVFALFAWYVFLTHLSDKLKKQRENLRAGDKVFVLFGTLRKSAIVTAVSGEKVCVILDETGSSMILTIDEIYF
jgi:preprotein translocase subunit YajC